MMEMAKLRRDPYVMAAERELTSSQRLVWDLYQLGMQEEYT